MNNLFEWVNGFSLDFDLKTGLSKSAETTKRYLSDMKGFYLNHSAYTKLLKDHNPLIYEYYELGAPETEGELAFGTTILYRGTVGNEYFITKGHFHHLVDTSEVYYVLSGQGCIVIENEKGLTKELFVNAGEVAYVPRGYAHRSINTGKVPFVFFYTFESNAGHDYKIIETQGF